METIIKRLKTAFFRLTLSATFIIWLSALLYAFIFQILRGVPNWGFVIICVVFLIIWVFLLTKKDKFDRKYSIKAGLTCIK